MSCTCSNRAHAHPGRRAVVRNRARVHRPKFQRSLLSQSYNREIMSAMARAAFVLEWANRMEEKGRSFSGQELMDVAPKKTSAAAGAWARGVAKAVVAANAPSLGVHYSHDLTGLYSRAINELGYPHTPNRFGHDLAMQAMGTGVSWSDDTTAHHERIAIPSREFYG